MKKRELRKIFARFLMAGTAVTVLAACGGAAEEEQAETPAAETEEAEEAAPAEEAETEEVDYAAVFEEAKAELDKAKEGQEVDFDKVTQLYTDNFQALVQRRDGELETQMDEQITAALAAGKDGSMNPVVSKQIFDKLLQKVFYTTMKAEFTEAGDNWADKELVKEEVAEAKDFYAIIQSTVEKRDAANGTTMVDAIAGGFSEIDAAVEADDELAFQLGKQVVDKTLMKTFYLAAGSVPNGYATKAAEAAKENPEEAQVEQAEGWAFHQSIAAYLENHAPEDAALIEEQFNLESDVTALDPAAVNKAYVRGFAQTAIDEYKESLEAWGEDKSVITALEGALFIDVIGADLKGMLGEAEYTALTEKAQTYLEAAKSQDKAAGEPVVNELIAALEGVIAQAK